MAFLTSTAAAFFGTASNDTLTTIGGIGPTAYTVVSGGLGNDIYFIDAFYNNASTQTYADVVNEAANGGIDTINLTLSTLFSSSYGTLGNVNPFTLFDHVENLNVTSSTDLPGYVFSINGNSSANNITFTGDANSAANINGGAGNDTITGGNNNDFLGGGAGTNSLIGGLGDDRYFVDSTNDIIVEAAGGGNLDHVYSSVSFALANNVEQLSLYGTTNINGTGNALNNQLAGSNGNNILSGLAGDDDIYGGYGNDTLQGGDGNDSLSGQNDNDSLNGGNGNDNLIGGYGNDIVRGGAGDDTLVGGLGVDNLDGNDGSDLYVVNGNGSVTIADTGTSGVDVIFTFLQLAGDLASGVEELGLAYGSSAIIGRGNALNNGILGNELNNTLFGLAGDDALAGVFGNDILDGGLGKDTLDGGLGNDIMRGGDGNDTYFVDSANDAVIELSAVLTTGGIDTVYSSVDFTLGNNVENVTLVGGAINGYGNSANNLLTGNISNNVLTGNAGKDTLNGGLGNDTMHGGDGDDTYFVDSTTDIVNEITGSGIDTVFSTSNFRFLTQTNGAVENATLLNVYGASRLYGSAIANILTGNDNNNFIEGADGNDTLIGGLGNDTLYGGAGIDSLVGGAGDDIYTTEAGDIVVEAANQGVDKVEATTTFSLALLGNIENLTLLTTNNINGTGNGLNNEMRGNSGDNRLDGGAGNDIINGYGGSDILIGGAGNDTIFFYGSGTVTELAGGGTDTLVSRFGGSIDLTSSTFANFENVELQFNSASNIIGTLGNNILTGNNNNNSISGGGGNDTLNGGGGNDTLDGGTGNDVYLVSSYSGISIFDSAGTDTVISSSAFSLDPFTSIENLTLTGNSNNYGYGNGLANTITGNDGNNDLVGNGGNDTLIGGLGNDTLNGGLGNDNMTGGLGNDTYRVDSASDVVVEAIGQGIDTVTSLVTFNLATSGVYVENVVLYGAANINAVGNALDNRLAGYGAGNNLLSGGIGDDTLIAADGADILTGGVGYDTFVTYSGNQTELDTITDFASGIDSLLLGGFAGLTFGGAGNSLNADQFALGDGSTGTAGNDDTRIIYNQTTGDLYYDLNGSNFGGQVQIFHFTGNPTLSATDIFDGAA